LLPYLLRAKTRSARAWPRPRTRSPNPGRSLTPSLPSAVHLLAPLSPAMSATTKTAAGKKGEPLLPPKPATVAAPAYRSARSMVLSSERAPWHKRRRRLLSQAAQRGMEGGLSRRRIQAQQFVGRACARALLARRSTGPSRFGTAAAMSNRAPATILALVLLPDADLRSLPAGNRIWPTLSCRAVRIAYGGAAGREGSSCCCCIRCCCCCDLVLARTVADVSHRSSRSLARRCQG
jgi:hypothetical protein